MYMNLPIVGMVVTISPSFSLYRIVVFPAASSPTVEKSRTYENDRTRILHDQTTGSQMVLIVVKHCVLFNFYDECN